MIWTIYRKELREVLRDRRTLIFMIVLPVVLIPLLLNLTTSLVSSAVEKARTETLSYALYHPERLPGLGEALTADAGFEEVTGVDEAEIAAAIEDERIKLALVVDAPVEAGVGPNVTVNLYYNGASATSKVKGRTE